MTPLGGGLGEGSGTGAEVTFGGRFETTFRSHLQVHGETMFQISRSWANRVRQEGRVNDGEIDRPTRSRTDPLTGRSTDRLPDRFTDRKIERPTKRAVCEQNDEITTRKTNEDDMRERKQASREAKK